MAGCAGGSGHRQSDGFSARSDGGRRQVNSMKKIIANNKKARHDYFIEETYEAGMVLTGTEIKSLRQGRVNLKESYAKVDNGELVVFGMHISPYEQGNRFNVDPLRPRKLLLHKQEIRKLIGYTTLKGLTIVPLNIYLNGRGLAKMEIGVARGKKLYDKRDDMAKRDAERHMQQSIKKSFDRGV
jgi:SsrA-binding protein